MKRIPLALPALVGLGVAVVLLALPGASPQRGAVLSPGDVQETANPSGDSPWTGQAVEVEGVVTAVSPQGRFFYLADPAGGAWSGVKVEGPSLDRRAGERVLVTGTVVETDEETRVRASSVSAHGRGRLPEPAVITVADLTGDGERWEGVLIRIRDITVGGRTSNFGEFAFHDATSYGGEADDEFFHSYLADPGDTFVSITGVVSRGFGDYRVEPRSDEDFRGYVSVRPNNAELLVRVTDGRGRFLPARITLFPTSGTLDLGPDDRASGAEDIAYIWKERQTVPVPAGTYDVVVSRGPEYGLHTQRVTVSAGQEARVEAVLRREVDTRGWLSGDFHLHSAPSSDTPLPVPGRIQSLVGEGVEWAVATDHNMVTDYAPVVREQGLAEWITTSIGDEITTRTPNFGHFNAWPLEAGSQEPPYRGQSPASLFAGARADPGIEVVQVNHPIVPDWGDQYFQTYAVNPFTGEPGVAGFSFDYDALEVFNGGFLEDGERNLGIWMRQLNSGHRITATGNSDSHHLVFREPGYPRNYVRSATDDPASASEDALVAAVLAGRVYVTYGPLLDFRVNGGDLGDLVAPEEGEVRMRARIQCASWLSVSEATVWSNGREIARVDLAPGAAGPQEWVVEFTDRPTVDSWYLLEVDGPGDLEPVRRGRWFRPYAFTNPVWVDVDGNGAFDPPGNVADATTIGDLDRTDASGVPVRIGDWVSVTGCATTDTRYGDPSLGLFYLEDGTGGIQVRESVGSVAEVRRGDRVRASGFVTQSLGETHLTECVVEILGPDGGCPAPVPVTTGEVAAGAEALEGRVVQVEAANVVSGSWPVNGLEGLVTVDDGSGPVGLLIPAGVIIPAEAGGLADFPFTALVTQRDFSAPYTSGYRLSLRDPVDLFGGPGAAATGAPGGSAGEEPLAFGIPRPNPFRESLRVPLLGRSRGETPRVEVLDVTGRRVRTLRAERGDSREIVWDGRDSGGKRAASGVYYLRLTGARNEGTLRVIKLK